MEFGTLSTPCEKKERKQEFSTKSMALCHCTNINRMSIELSLDIRKQTMKMLQDYLVKSLPYDPFEHLHETNEIKKKIHK